MRWTLGKALPGLATAKFVDGETTVISAGGKYDLGGGVTIHLAITSGSVNGVVGEARISGACADRGEHVCRGAASGSSWYWAGMFCTKRLHRWRVD